MMDSDKLWKFWQRVRAAWRIWGGKAVMYRVKVHGPVELVPDQDLHVLDCQVNVSQDSDPK